MHGDLLRVQIGHDLALIHHQDTVGQLHHFVQLQADQQHALAFVALRHDLRVDKMCIRDRCKGARYNRETLEVKYKDKNIHDVLEMTVEEACAFFENIPRIHRKLKTLLDVGLGYIKLGQSATTLSGGEAQRVKLALELAKRETGQTVYILDEPTTGLHVADVHRLVKVLDKLVDAGNTCLLYTSRCV